VSVPKAHLRFKRGSERASHLTAVQDEIREPRLLHLTRADDSADALFGVLMRRRLRF